VKRVRTARARGARLTQGDIELLQSAALALHAPSTLAALKRVVPKAFLSIVPARHFDTSEFAIDRKARRLRMRSCWASTDEITPELAVRMEQTLYEHPFMQHTLRHGYAGALTLADFIPMPKLRKMPLFRELLEPNGVAHLLGIVTPGPRGITTMTYARGPRDRAFSMRDRALFQLLAPHLAQARLAVERRTGVRVSQHRPVTDYGLTARELELGRWLAKGKTNAEIASILRIQVRTVEKHLERVYEKLGVENRTTAALLLASSPEH
jgi:DNA-binding CsgD family transcriptional regulator